jgi:hypothetical protein
VLFGPVGRLNPELPLRQLRQSRERQVTAAGRDHPAIIPRRYTNWQ